MDVSLKNAIDDCANALLYSYTSATNDHAIFASSISASHQAEEKEKMPDGAKTLLSVNGKGLYVKIADQNGNVGMNGYLMPDIADVNVIENDGKMRAVIVTFTDGKTEKAALYGDDVFSLEHGLSVCITKKLLSDKYGEGNGSSLYNKLIDHGVKVYNKAQKEAEKKAAEEAAKKRKYEKTVAKKAAKREKREREARENQIEIQKEAILRAMREFRSEPTNILRSLTD